MAKKLLKQQDSHKFSAVPGFKETLQKLVSVPKDEIERREKAAKTPRRAEKPAG